jgi:hypothetical protein
VTIDTTPPVAPAIAGYSDDTGTAGDRITSDNDLTLIGTAEVGATVEIFDGATSLGTTVVASSNWIFITGALAEGAHSFTAVTTAIKPTL